jgi:hypothetical protein
MRVAAVLVRAQLRQTARNAILRVFFFLGSLSVIG